MNDTVDIIGGWVQAISVIVVALSIGIGIWQFRKHKGEVKKHEESD